MSVTFKIFTKQAGRPTLFQTREFDALPVTLGRDESCTVALDDPLKHISRVHVELREDGGGYWLCVVSKVNPVMVKGQRHGPGSRVELQSGDSFDMGEFEVQVAFAETKRTSPAEKKPLNEVLLPDDAPAFPEDLPPPEPGLFDEPTSAGSDEPTYMGPAVRAAPRPVLEATTPRGPAAKPPAGATPMQHAVRAFLEGAGMPDKALSAEQSERLLREGGAILRAAMEGLVTLLVARGDMRKDFGMQERDDNPLKRMGGAQETMDFLFDPTTRREGSLQPVQAIAAAAEDLRVHELALMAGMRAAILGAVNSFDGQVLEKALDKSAGGFSFGGRKARLWDLFVAHQQKLSQDAQQDFNKLFGRDFMAAYEAELRRLKSRE